jgi:lipopolysaccharide transport system ATP-binding protein
MSNTVIKVENLSKIYRLGEIGTGSIGQDVDRWFKTKVLGKEDPFLKIGETNDRASKGDSDIVYSLRDINFEIQQGDAVGIIGRNGAGKSTLLKILSRVTTPTIGKINIKGRVASLLEVGTGFHPELTGRENIYLNGAILGMRKREIDRKLDEIIDFSGVERYVDTPVKRYSSGMYVRLAFAVAAHLESEILVVDEVLAVGDLEFQKKAMGKMNDVNNKDGRTILFVSHNLASLKSLCTKGYLLMNGKLLAEGEIQNIITEYERTTNKKLNSNWTNEFDRDNTIYLDEINILDIERNPRTDFLSNESVLVEMIIIVKEPHHHVKIGFDLMKSNELAFRSQQVDTSSYTKFESGRYSVICQIPKNLLNEGSYKLKPNFSVHCVRNLLGFDDIAVVFNVKINTGISDYHSILHENNHPGSVYPLLNWEIIETNK